MKSYPIRIVDYDAGWPAKFTAIGIELRKVFRERALRIDHIGSTSVVGLCAKPIIDIQISVASFEPLDTIVAPIESIGFVFNPYNSDLTKRFFRDPPAGQNVHIHVRIAGCWSEQFALLFRDYLRHHSAAATAYGVLKKNLASNYGEDREGYTEAKSEFIFSTMAKAHVWSMGIGWVAEKSDV
ncbi:MAG: GrpB family protein [Anaerolineaceae bacterium]|nr:GrpB family protein [Anaerolineaceae bacterium]